MPLFLSPCFFKKWKQKLTRKCANDFKVLFVIVKYQNSSKDDVKSAGKWLSKKISENMSETGPLNLPTWQALIMVYRLNLKYRTSMNSLQAEKFD